MKKVIFISALAIAAAVSCTKSDIVDTKFNEAISFENYLGRTAQTKVAEATTVGTAGLYGFYTGKDSYVGSGDNATTPNLWKNAPLKSLGTYWGVEDDPKYWTNASDKYTFLAYAPYTDNTGTILKTNAAAVPTVTYAVPQNLDDQIDLLYANTPANEQGANGHVNMVKPTDGTVALKFNHALSRITVKASEAQDDYGYTIKALSLTGTFVSKGTLDLYTANNTANVGWTFVDADKVSQTYHFLPYTEAETDDYTVTGTATNVAGANYLMVIPVDFTGTKTEEVDGKTVTTYPNAATLSVSYTTTFDGHESTLMTKTLPIPTKFEMGKAYSINLVFEPNDDNLIKFSVEVMPWDPETGVVIPNGNPEDGTTVANPTV